MGSKLVVAVILTFLLLLPLVAAKNVVFVTGNDACHRGSCSCLGADEAAFCDRMKTNLGFNVTIVGESYAIANDSLEWWPWVSNANLIFLGDTSYRTANVSGDRDRFCGNVSLVTADRKVFATFINAYMNGTNTSGCAFSPQLTMVDFSVSTNNTCGATATPSNFRKLAEGYITSAMASEPVLYTANSPVKIHGPASPSVPVGWIGMACPNPTGVFSVLSTSSKGVFWGMEKATLFTNDAWGLFDRTIWDVLGETGWVVTPYLIPSTPTTNGTALVVAKVTERGQLIGASNIVNFTLGSMNGSLTYQNGYWLGGSVAMPPAGAYTLDVKGWDASMMRGSSNQSVTVGTLNVAISSGDYMPGQDYTIIANVTNGSEVQPTTVYFSIWNTTNWTRMISNQPMALSGNQYTAAVLGSETARWVGTLLIEVTAGNATLSGGSYKYVMIASALTGNLTVDKTSYKPGEIVNLSLTTPFPPNVTTANMTIIDSAGTETPLGGMTRVNSTLWTMSYTLPPGSLNGTHIFNASFTDGVRSSWTSRTADVKPYEIYFSKNKALYATGESVAMTVQIVNAYTTAINFSIAIVVANPSNATTAIGNGTITGSGSWNTSWQIPTTAEGGTYTLTVNISDTVNPSRITNLSDSFMVNTTAYLSVSPVSWSLNVTTPNRYTQTFVLNNSGGSDMENITITPSAAIAPFIDVSPSIIALLSRGNSTNLTVGWNASVPVTHMGTLVVAAAGHPAMVTVPLTLSMVTGGFVATQNWLSVDPSAIVNTTVAGTSWDATFTLSNSGTAPLTSIEAVVSEALKGMVTSKEIPTSVPAGGSATLKLAIDTAGASAGSVTGTVQVKSSAGTADITVSIKIVGDLGVEADTLASELGELSVNASAVAAGGKDVTAVTTLIDSTSKLLTEARTAWGSNDYATADAKIGEAKSNIDNIKSQLLSLSRAPASPQTSSGIIWAVAAVVIIAIAGVTVFKFKNQLKELIDRLLKRKPKAPPAQPEYPQEEYGQEEEAPQEEAPPEEEGGESRYRTEWY